MSEYDLHGQIDRMGELLVLADASDLRSLAEAHTGFEAVSAWAVSVQDPELAEIAKKAAALIERIILEEELHPAEAIETLVEVVGHIQAIVRDSRSVSDFRWPSFFSVGSEPAAPQMPEKEEHADLEGSYALTGDPNLLSEFVTEAREHLDAADTNLLHLETDGNNEGALAAVFRAFHTIKGVAGFLALEEIQWIAHESENLLDRARKHELTLSGPAMDVTFDAVDMLKRLVSNVARALETGSTVDRTRGLSDLVAKVKAVASGKIPAPAPSVVSTGRPAGSLGQILVESGAVTEQAVETALRRQAASGSNKLGEILVETGKTTPTQVKRAVALQEQGAVSEKLGEILVETGAVEPADVSNALARQQRCAPGPKLGELLVRAGEVEAKEVAQALRQQGTQGQGVQVREPVKVDADRLDRLVDMIGELVIAESMVSQSEDLASLRSPELARSLMQLDKITRELQEMGTSLRMVPIRPTFQKMARLVRDLAKKSDKQVEFCMVGEDTELDKTVVDKIGDPLVHMIRNAVDHGLEADPSERERAGKPPTGRVELRAFHKGGSIHVEIEDDGRGLDRNGLLKKARERGLIRDGEAMTDRDVWNLVFEPGLSTAKTVTDVSGRGVGMDVVKRNIEALRGQVDIQSRAGQGTTFSIRLPLTLAIIDGMVVRVGEERYIIPTLSIVTSIRPEAAQILTVVGRGEMLKLQGKLLPLARLARLFDMDAETRSATEGIVVVIEDEGARTGLFVDEILGQQQIVIKSLGEALQGTPGIAGGAIMPDGNVGLILDVGGVVRLMGGESASAAEYDNAAG